MSIQFGVPFDCMRLKYSDVDLNDKVVSDESIEALEKIIIDAGGSISAEIKEDGWRCLAHADKDDVLLYTREKNSLDTRCFPDVLSAVKSLGLKKTILDAELRGTAKGRMKALEAVEKRGRGKFGTVSDASLKKYFKEERIEKYPLTLFVFDLVMLDGVSCINEKYTKRRALIEQLIGKDNELRVSSMSLLRTPEDVITTYHFAVNKKKLEGIVLKQPNLPYILGDDKNWIKLKKFEPLDLVVVGLYKNKETPYYHQALVATRDSSTNLYQTLGVVSLIRKNHSTGNSFGTDIAEILSGNLSSEVPSSVVLGDRPADVYIAPEKSVVLEVRAMNIWSTSSTEYSCNYGGKKYSLRIAHVREIRDKLPEQASSTELVAKLQKMQK